MEPIADGEETKSRPLLPWVAATFAVTATVVGLAVWAVTRPAPPVISRLTVNVPPGVQIASLWPTLSPDGRVLAFKAIRDGQSQIYTRRLDQLEAVAVRGSEGAVGRATFSPDGRQIAFNAGGVLKQVPVAGGPSVSLAEAINLGEHWGPDDTIVFPRPDGGLSVVPAVGGAPKEITTALEEGAFQHQDPRFLPDGRAILFVIVRAGSPKQIAVLSLDTRRDTDPGGRHYPGVRRHRTLAFHPGRGRLGGTLRYRSTADSGRACPDAGTYSGRQ